MNHQHWKRSFFTIYAGQAFSAVGSSAAQFAILWYLTARTGSPIVLMFASLAGFLPMALAGPFAGVWIDRVSRKAIMMGADGFIALVSALLAVSFLFGEPPIWGVCLVLLLRALGSVFQTPAMQAAIPQLVPADYLTRAGGWGQLIESACYMAGPVLGAMLMVSGSLPYVMLVDVAGAILAVGTLFFVRLPALPRQHTKLHVLHDLRDGLRTVRANRPLMALAAPMLVAIVLFAPLGSLFPLMVSSHFGGGAWHSSISEIAFAGGLLTASLVLGTTGGMKRRFLMISLSLGALGVCSLAAGLLPPNGFWLFIVLCVGMGAAGNFYSVPYISYMQETIPAESLGKALSLVTSAMSFATPIGLVLSGPGAQLLGVAGWFALSGAVTIAVGIWSWLSTRRFDSSAPPVSA